jgi:hypothetical protein
MNDLHDDWRTRSDFERDDIASEAMSRGLDWADEQEKLRLQLQSPKQPEENN